MKTKETLPETPFDMFKYLDDNVLVKGVVEKISFFEEDNILVGIPHITYDEKSCSRSLTASERCSVPYAENLCLSLEEARCGRLKNLKMMLDIYEHNKAECVQSFLTRYEQYIANIQKTKLYILELEQQLKVI